MTGGSGEEKKSTVRSGHYIGKLMVLIGAIVLVPILSLPFFPGDSEYLPAFLIPGGLSVLAGGFIWWLRSKPDGADRMDTVGRNSLTVVFAWCYGFVLGALPLVLGHQLTFVQALFEAVSGFTTTGLSTMDVSVVPHVFLFHRGFMQFCGGLGFVMVMLLFVRGTSARELFSAEGHPDQLTPNIGRTARIIFSIYLGFTVVGTILYCICGMNFFDSLIHSMCALSTGGFSNRMDSIGAYNSLSIEGVTIGLMLIGTTNFAILWFLVRGKFADVFKTSEVRLMLGLVIIASPLIAVGLAQGVVHTFPEGLRVALFNVASAISTTGYSTVSYANWPPYALGVMIILMFIGGGVGSTAGGLKLSRCVILLKILKEQIHSQIAPGARIPKPTYRDAFGPVTIDERMKTSILGFFTVYTLIFVVGTLGVAVTAGCDLTSAMFEFASSLGTVGLSIGITGPATGGPQLIVEMIGMGLGRLEIFVVLVGARSGYTWMRDTMRLWNGPMRARLAAQKTAAK